MRQRFVLKAAKYQRSCANASGAQNRSPSRERIGTRKASQSAGTWRCPRPVRPFTTTMPPFRPHTAAEAVVMVPARETALVKRVSAREVAEVTKNSRRGIRLRQCWRQQQSVRQQSPPGAPSPR